MSEALNELRYAIRQLVSRPLWAATVISILTLGIAANIAMFSAFEAWVLRPLDFKEPDALVAVYEHQPQRGLSGLALSPKNYVDLAKGQTAFSELGAFNRHRYNLNDPNQPVRLDGARITASLFPMFGKAPIVGRVFTEREDQPGQPAAVAIISEQIWRERFSSEPSVVGRTIRLDGRAHEIVGVMEAGFKFPEWAEIWTPLGANDIRTNRDERTMTVIARLAEGASLDEASQQVAGVGARLASQYPETNRDFGFQLVPLRRDMVPEVIDTALAVSLVSGVFVLLIICANVANLMLAQAAARGRETAVRTALGATRARLLRQNLVESVCLTLPAGLAGAALGVVTLNYLISWVPVDPPYLFATRFSPTAAWYALGLSLFAGVICAMAPTVRNSSKRVFELLKSNGERAGTSRATRRFRSGLIVFEIALSTAMLVGALLMVKSFLQLQKTDRGYRTQGVWTTELSLSGDEVQTSEQRRELVARLSTTLATLEGVSSAGISSNLPAGQSYRVRAFVAEDQAATASEANQARGLRASAQGIAGDYFDVLEFPFVTGRGFTDLETLDGGDVAVVSQGFAERLWNTADPLGRRIGRPDSKGTEWYRVVGVVPDVDYGRDIVNMGGEVPAIQVYFPYPEVASTSIAIAVQSDAPASSVASQLRDTLQTAAPGLPATEVLSMDEAIFRVQWVSGFFSRQLMLYALFAFAIAALGVYGLTADSVSRRQRELAIRSALGADRSRLVQMILRESGTVTLTGLFAGIGAAFLTTRAASQMLIDVSPRDPATFSFVFLSFLAVATLATLIPARQATAVSTVNSLRSD